MVKEKWVMADGAVTLLLKHKFQELRAKCNQIFSLAFENVSGVTKTANIFDNKGGLSGTNAFTSYSQDEIDSWIGDGADRMIATIYDQVNNQMVAVRADFAFSNTYWYRIDNNTNVASLQATVPTPTTVGGGARAAFFNPFNSRFYLLYEDASNDLTVMSRANNLGGVTGAITVPFAGENVEAVEVNPTNGDIYIFGSDNIHIVDGTLFTVTVITPPNATQIEQGGFVSQKNELWVFGNDGLADYFDVYDLTGSSWSLVSSAALNNQCGSQIFEDGNLVVGITGGTSSPTLTKWDASSKEVVYKKPLRNDMLSLSAYHQFYLDSSDNIYILTNQGYYIYSKNGDYLTFYNRNDRTVNGGGSGSMFLGGLGFVTTPRTTFVPESGKLFIPAALQTVFAATFNYAGGLTGLNLTTSSSNYQMALTEFNTEPILVKGLIFYYKNGGRSLDNNIKYLKETSTGACDRRMIQPRSYINAMDSTDNVVEIDLCDRPLVIDSAHFFRLDVPAGEKITMVMFYEQAQKKDILLNKILG